MGLGWLALGQTGLGKRCGSIFGLWRNIGVGREQIPRMRYMFHEYHFTDLIKKVEVNVYSHQSKCMCVDVN